MGRASRRKKERRENGPGFIEAIADAQAKQQKDFVKKMGQKVEVTIEDGEMKVKPTNEGEGV